MAIILFVSFVFTSAQSMAEGSVVFTQGQRATIILPIAPNKEMGRYYRLERCENDQIFFEEEIHLQPHIPYIIVPNEDFVIDLNSIDLEGCYRDTVAIEGISFIGSYTREEFDYLENVYIDIIDTTPDCSPGDMSMPIIGALRAYLEVDWDIVKNQWEKMDIVLQDQTGVENISETLRHENQKGGVYDLSGRRVDAKAYENENGKLKKGIYIKDGKKTVVR